jgi:GPH family glycoside/pentoside/hexuronide:cation symporter
MAQAKVPLLTKLSYGFGAIAYGVKNNGFDYFLLLFYSQILGVEARMVGLALLIALVFDAFSDPIVGYLSDNTRSRWGRRHPWMYFAAIPVSIAYYFLWSPPGGLSGNQLFAYLVMLSILIRTLITLYEVPSSALAPEITRDYDERVAHFFRVDRRNADRSIHSGSYTRA